MGTRVIKGFTIIETVLFLGVTGLLVLGAMVGVGANVNIQRYKDATETFNATIQSLYSDVTNVQNGRSSNQYCNSIAAVIDDPGGDERGQSRCMIIGKYVRLIKGDVTTYNVLAVENASFSPSASDTDVSILHDKYYLNLSQTDSIKTKMEWGTEIIKQITPTTTSDRGTILIVRSPESGQIYTFSSNTVPTDTDIANLGTTVSPAFVRDMVVAGDTTPGQAAQTYCIESSGLFSQGQMAIYIAPYATSSSAVELVSNDTLASKGLPYRC